MAETPSISLRDIKEKLETMCGLQVLKPAICKYLKKVLARKLLTKPAKERFTDVNMRYTQAFIAVLSRIDKKKLDNYH